MERFLNRPCFTSLAAFTLQKVNQKSPVSNNNTYGHFFSQQRSAVFKGLWISVNLEIVGVGLQGTPREKKSFPLVTSPKRLNRGSVSMDSNSIKDSTWSQAYFRVQGSASRCERVQCLRKLAGSKNNAGTPVRAHYDLSYNSIFRVAVVPMTDMSTCLSVLWHCSLVHRVPE